MARLLVLVSAVTSLMMSAMLPFSKWGRLRYSYAKEPNIPASTGREDTPLDHALTKEAVVEALRRAGVSDPLKPIEPIHASYLQSGKFPEDAYYFIVGCDGKVYGQGQTPPKGEKKLLEVSLSMWDKEWIASAMISHDTDKYREIDAAGGSGGDSDALLPSEQGKGFESDLKNLRRWQMFKAYDPHTAARAAVVDLYSKGHLYDVEHKFRESADEAHIRLKPHMQYIRDRIKELGGCYELIPDNPAKRTLAEAFKRSGVRGKAMQYLDSWSGWLSVTWDTLKLQYGRGGFYGYHLRALEDSLRAFQAQGYAQQSDLVLLDRGMADFKQVDQKVGELLEELVRAYAGKAKVLDRTAEVNDAYWSARDKVLAMRGSKKITIEASLTAMETEEEKRDAALAPLKKEEEQADKEVSRINGALNEIAEKKRIFQDIKQDPVRQECEC